MPQITQTFSTKKPTESKTKAVTRLEQTLATGGKEEILLALDRSGSMDITFLDHKKRRIDGAKDAVDRIVRASHRGMSAFGLAAFSHEIEYLEKIGSNFTGVISRVQMLEPDGGTRYAPIFDLALNTLDKPPHRIILLSDGEPEDGPKAIDYAETCGILGVRIDCVGIGESNPALLKEIAKRSQGVYAYADDLAALVKTFAALETRARFQLEFKPGGVIKL